VKGSFKVKPTPSLTERTYTYGDRPPFPSHAFWEEIEIDLKHRTLNTQWLLFPVLHMAQGQVCVWDQETMLRLSLQPEHSLFKILGTGEGRL
jgi:hypothetical protein